MTAFSLWHPGHPGYSVDLVVQEPFDFDVVYHRALRVPLEEIQTVVVSREDLVAMRRSAGRA
jgi:hypothetical protein